MQRPRETGRPCTRAHHCTAQHTYIPYLNPSSMSLQRQQPILTTATRTSTTAIITRQSKHSRVALQYVSFAQDKGLNARGMTSKGCPVQGKLAVPAHAHISAPPNTHPFPASSSRIMSLQKQQPILITSTQTPTTAIITRHSKHSRVALQHVGFASNQRKDTIGVSV